MSAVPVGYEAFHSLRRKAVTLICFILASTMAIGITVYVDSYSIHEWDKNLDVGSVAIRISGESMGSYFNNIKDINGITKAAELVSGGGTISHELNISGYSQWVSMSGTVLAPDSEFMEAFPDYTSLAEGRYPNNATEIAITEQLQESLNIQIGDTVNFDSGSFNLNCTVIGVYTHPSGYTSPYYWYPESIAIVNSSLIDVYSRSIDVFADVNRAKLTAFNPTASLQYLNRIDESIRRLDPNYGEGGYYSSIQVNDRLASGISSYIFWVQNLRIGEMLRSTSVLLLVVLVTFLAIRHNVNERRYEESILVSRGASQSDLEKVVTHEVLILSIVSCLAGIPLGLLLSRVAISATGFFTFKPVLALTEPVMISLESLIITAIVSIALPMLTLGGYRAIYSTKKNVDEQRGKVAKLSRGLGLIKWDLLVVLLSGLLLLAILSGGPQASSNPLLALLMPIIPLPLFLGVASLSMKALKRGANFLSRLMKKVVGEIPSSIGIRRIGKEASSAGAAAMVLVLAICISWNSAIVGASLPVTAQNQARLDIGSDLTFELNNVNYAAWTDFINNVTSHEMVESATLVSQKTMYLSADYRGICRFMAVNPMEYLDVGYDYLGNRLNDSDLGEMIQLLDSTTDGAIITKDIASSFDLAVGDVLRATTMEDQETTIIFRIIGITNAIPELPAPTNPYYSYQDYYRSYRVGSTTILVNREFFGTKFDLIMQSLNYLCVGLEPNSNGTRVAEDVIASGGAGVILSNTWDSVSSRVDAYIGNVQYKMERAIDTMLTVLTVGTIIGAFIIYAAEGVRSRRREIALLRSIGASRLLIIKSQAAEMIVLLLFSLLLLIGYSPLFLTTSISSAGISYSNWYQIYPISVFPVIPWIDIILVLTFFIACVSIFIMIIAAVSSKINLAANLNTAWAEASPYGGEL